MKKAKMLISVGDSEKRIPVLTMDAILWFRKMVKDIGMSGYGRYFGQEKEWGYEFDPYSVERIRKSLGSYAIKPKSVTFPTNASQYRLTTSRSREEENVILGEINILLRIAIGFQRLFSLETDDKYLTIQFKESDEDENIPYPDINQGLVADRNDDSSDSSDEDEDDEDEEESEEEHEND